MFLETLTLHFIVSNAIALSRIFFALHHLIVDAVSWRILSEDLENLYYKISNHKELSLGDKGTSYRQWSNIVKNYSTKDNNEKEKR